LKRKFSGTPPSSEKKIKKMALTESKSPLTKAERCEKFKNHEDIPGETRMKSNAEPDYPSGVDENVTYKLATRYMSKFDEGYNPNLKDYSILKTDSDGKAFFENPKNQDQTYPESGKNYIFVTMLDGIKRIGSGKDGSNAHATLSGLAAFVRYAGTVIFQDGYPSQATRKSGTYTPLAEKARELSGIDCEFEKNIT
jgi:hypothetical protein